MHSEDSKKYFIEQLQDIMDCPRIKERGAVVNKDGGLAFILSTTKKITGQHPIIRVDCTGFDLDPPLVEFLNPISSQKLENGFWPGGTVDHHIYGKAICLRGTRGYHTHESHLQDSFDLYRNGYTLLSLVLSLLDRVDQWEFPGGGPYG